LKPYITGWKSTAPPTTIRTNIKPSRVNRVGVVLRVRGPGVGVPAGASRCLRLASRLAAVFPAERQGFARAVQAHVLAWFLQNYRPQYVTICFYGAVTILRLRCA